MENKIKFPDLSVYDWVGMAASETASVNPDERIVELVLSNHIFEWLATLRV